MGSDGGINDKNTRIMWCIISSIRFHSGFLRVEKAPCVVSKYRTSCVLNVFTF